MAGIIFSEASGVAKSIYGECQAPIQMFVENYDSDLQSKSHLTATGNVQGAGASSVPPAQMAIFRKMNPGATDAQIQKFYNQYKKRQGG